MQMNKILMIWPKSKETLHINYHYTQFGEIVDYLDRKVDGKIEVVDEDIQIVDVIKMIKESGITKVIMHLNYENVENGFRLGEEIKRNFQDIPIFAYGNVIIMLPDLFLKSPFDVIHSNGDCEISIKSFIDSYKDELECDIENLRGSKVISDGRMYSTKPGEYIDEDEWGVSRENQVPIKKYDKIKGKNRFVLNVSRGCPFGCEHCLIQLTEGNNERRRSIQNIRMALEEIEKSYKHVKIWAANFTLNKGYVKEFCDLMKTRFPNLTWECTTRIDLVKDFELLRLMNEAGCKQISIGVESLRNEELIGTKDFTEEEISRAILNIQNAGIKVKCCIMLGMEGQKRADIIKTFSFLTSRRATVRPTIYTPYHLLSSNVELSDLSMYNRKTYRNSNIKDVKYSELVSLVNNPLDYLKILGIRQPNDDDAR